MELHLALKEIVEKEGSNILTEPRLVNMLADYNAYNNSSYRFITKILIENAYFYEIKNSLNKNNLEIEINVLSTKAYDEFGFDKSLVLYIIESILYSLNKTDKISSLLHIKECGLHAVQTQPQVSVDCHMSFMGVSFNNHVDNFQNELKNQGISISTKNEKTASMKGRFGPYDNCFFMLDYTCISKVIYRVCISIEVSSYAQLMTEYDNLLKSFITKYGEFTPEGEDGWIHNDSVGMIAIFPDKETNELYVVYTDNKNVSIKNIEEQQLLLNDI